MAKNIFNNSPFSPFTNDNNHPFPGNKGLLLFYNDGNIKEMYGREHVMMMQEIGYWYIDNWQDFMLNYSYNRIIVMMIEFNTVLLYLPNIISKEQKDSLINYIEKNVSEENIKLLNFYIMLCLENNNDDELTEIKRDARGMIKHFDGLDVTESKPFNYEDLYNYLNINNIEKYKLLK